MGYMLSTQGMLLVKDALHFPRVERHSVVRFKRSHQVGRCNHL